MCIRALITCCSGPVGGRLVQRVLLAAMAVPALVMAVPALAIESYTLKSELSPQNIVLDGTVEAIRKSTVAAQTSGTVSQVFYDVDDSVEPGAVLLQISDTEQQARLEQTEAAARAARASLTDARQNAERITGIYKRKLASQAQYDQARNNLDAANASYSKAVAALKEARKQVSYTRVIAPYGGIVTERHVEQGEVVAPGSPLMSGIDLNALRVNIYLPQRYAAGVRKQGQARVRLSDGRYLTASSLTVFPYADAATRNFRVRINLPEQQSGLYPGMMVKVKVPVAEKEHLVIPEQALVVRGDLKAVYLLNEQDEPRLCQVRIGYQADGQIEILSGLQEGDRIALDPHQVLELLYQQRKPDHA